MKREKEEKCIVITKNQDRLASNHVFIRSSWKASIW